MAEFKTIAVKAFGKINLMLDIVGRRDDGYHELETVMQSVSIFDTLTLAQNGKGQNEIICDKAGFPCNSSNLIWKAIDAFEEFTGQALGGITVTVDKQLPSMAGMAGGSADCAATLHALNEMTGAALSQQQLCEIGVKLGADVPFCIVGGTQMCRGIGEKMQPLRAPSCAFVIVKPDVSVSTPAAFKRYDSLENAEKCDTQAFLKSLESGSLTGLCREMFNALEYAAQQKEIEKAKKDLITAGALGSLMTGSGSAVFGVFEDNTCAQKALEKMKDSYSQAWLCVPEKKGHEFTSL